MKTEWISVDEAAAILGIGRLPVNGLARMGQLLARKASYFAANGFHPWELDRTAVEDRATRMRVIVPTEAECGVDWMPFNEACKVLGLSRESLYKRIEKGFLESTQFGPAQWPKHFVNRKQVLEHLIDPPHVPKPEHVWRDPNLTDEERGWFGGLIDGEGCISLIRMVKPNGFQWYSRVTVGNTNPFPCNWARECFGGCVNRKPRQNPRHKEIHQWQVNCATSAATLRYLRPSIRMKAEQADLAIRFQEHLDSKVYRIVPLDVLAWREEQCAKMHVLNRRGS